MAVSDFGRLLGREPADDLVGPALDKRARYRAQLDGFAADVRRADPSLRAEHSDWSRGAAFLDERGRVVARVDDTEVMGVSTEEQAAALVARVVGAAKAGRDRLRQEEAVRRSRALSEAELGTKLADVLLPSGYRPGGLTAGDLEKIKENLVESSGGNMVTVEIVRDPAWSGVIRRTTERDARGRPVKVDEAWFDDREALELGPANLYAEQKCRVCGAGAWSPGSHQPWCTALNAVRVDRKSELRVAAPPSGRAPAALDEEAV